MKKLALIILTAIVCLCLTGCADDIVTPNKLTDVTPSETATPNATSVTPASDFEYEINTEENCVVITRYIGASEHVVIPSEIEGLPVRLDKNNSYKTHKGVFEGSKVKTVVMTEISIIGANAFKDCEELTEVIVSDKLRTIYYGAFENCKKLERLDLSETSVVRINEWTFRGCVSLKQLELPDGLLEILRDAFYDCEALEEMHLPESLILIEDNAFINCTSLKRINIPANVSLHRPIWVVFDNTALEVVEFDSGREIVDGYAYFNFPNNPCNVIIPETVKVFHEDMFASPNVSFTFLGDSPTIEKDTLLYGDTKRIVYYDPGTDGWDDWEWKDHFILIPKEK